MMHNSEFQMKNNTKLDKIDFSDMTWCGYKLNTDEFPTVDKSEPRKLTDEETEIIQGLKSGFIHSEKMRKHLNFMFSKGSIYLRFNGNLLYHGCVPVDEGGNFSVFSFNGKKYYGKAFMDFCEKKLREAYKKKGNPTADFAWFLWCSPHSPLFGKKNMATFERMYIDDKSVHSEEKQPYFLLWDNEELCNKIMTEFGVDCDTGHIINGHIPVRFKDGESPVKANGKLILIDGGMSTAYRKQTGIAGYTLIYNSYGLAITSHAPFESIRDIIEKNHEMMSQKYIVEKVDRRILIEDTDQGKALLENVKDLKNLMFLYDSGVISQKHSN